MGQRLLTTDKHALDVQFGVGAGQNDLADVTDDMGLVITPGTSEDEFTSRISGDYTWTISENASFSQKLNVNVSSSNTYTESLSELRAGIIGDVFLVLAYVIKHNSDVQPDKDKTDTYTSINLEYSF